jgi:hypothetical protein
MKGGKNRQPLGYTILEVMIVLMISGFMFLLASQFINGKQERTGFTSGANEMASKLQDIIQQVSAGQYSDIPLTCTQGGGAGSPPTFAQQVSLSQGAESDCVFVGKFIHFWTNSVASDYEVFTLAGNRLIPGTSDPAVKSTDVVPVPVFGNNIDLTVQSSTPQSLEIDPTGSLHGITVISAATGLAQAGINGLGFVQSFGTLVTSGTDKGTYNPGSQTINLVYNSALNRTQPPGIGANGSIVTMRNNPLLYATSASICLTDGTQFAVVRIGNTGSTDQSSQLSVTAHIIGVTGDPTCH